MVMDVTRDEFNALEKSMQGVSDQFQSTSGKAHNYAVTMGVVERAQQNLVNIWRGSVIGKAQVVGKWFKNLSKVTSKYSNDSKDMADANKNLTIIQRNLIAPLVSGTKAAGLSQKMWDKHRDSLVTAGGKVRWVKAGFMSLISVVMSILGILGIVGFAWAAFTLASEGAAAPIAQFVAEHFPQFSGGLQKIINLLQGDMTGSIKSYLLPAFILLKVAMMLLPGILGPLFVAILVGVALFKRFEEQGYSWKESAIGAIAGVVAAFFILMSPGKIIKVVWFIIKAIFRFLGIGWTLILVGLAGLFLAASGKLSGFWSVVIGIMSAAALYVGMLLVSAALGTTSTIGGLFAMIPFFWVAALLLMVVMVYRFRKPLGDAFVAIFKWIATLIIDIMLAPMNAILWVLNQALPGNPFKTNYEAGDFIEGLAEGGPVKSGRSYLVGERGPELFTAGSSGTITPNHQMGGVTNNITLSIDVGGVTDHTDKRALARQISDELNKELRRLGGQPTRGRY